MPRITKYRSLSHDEVLRLFSDKRYSSDIIEEVCQRLERSINNGDVDDAFQEHSSCPVCDASLKVEDHGQHYELKEA